MCSSRTTLPAMVGQSGLFSKFWILYSLSGNKYCCLGRAVAILILASCSGFYFWAKLKPQPLITQPLRDTAGETSTSINTVPQR